jgi:carotenoid cleavage dioxygenase-like enzyme
MRRTYADSALFFDRRQFLKATALVAAQLGVGLPWLSGCGSDGSGTSETAAPLQVDPSVAWWLQNNFAPVFDELTVTDLEVRGRIPAALNGTYVRNGSNPQNADSPHWFFGDGMLHGVRIEGGRAKWYRNRYVRTPLYLAGVGFAGDRPPFGGNNQSNVSCVWHAGKLLTSGEIGFPHQIDPTDLSTIDVYDFGRRLNTSFTAHPKIDPVTGNLHFFGYWFLPPYLTYHVADPSGRIVHTAQIQVSQPTMIHSFAITESDVIFWELPVVFSLEDALAGVANPFHWTPSYGARIGILPLGGRASEIRWVEIEPCYVFHEVNAYRAGSEVIIDVCRHDKMFGGEDLGQTLLRIHRWRVDTSSDSLTFGDEIVTGEQFELPSHDRRFTGRPHRYGWFVHTREHPDTIDFAGIGRIDYASGDIRLWNPGATRHANEAFFVADGDREGDGWLLTFVWDHSTDVSHLAILDARRIEDGPVAEIRMPRRVPDGFHGVWIPD